MRSKFEIRAQKELEAEGYRVDYKIRPRMNPRGYSVDYFGLFDLLAYKDGKFRFISIKGTAGVPSIHIEMIGLFPMPKGCQREIWQYRKLASDRRKFVPKKTIVK